MEAAPLTPREGRGDLPIVGAGPAGLVAALTLARAGRGAVVSEQRAGVGSRFHGDHQGLENWTTDEDALDELARIGVEPSFEHTGFRECVFLDGRGRAYACRSERPLFYLVRRGSGEGTLDRALQEQADAAGGTLQLGSSARRLPVACIVAHGPQRPDAIAVGYVFDCDHGDAAFGAVSSALAPGGYAYLLVCRRRATLACCLFADFHQERRYLERAVDFFDRATGIRPGPDARRFGGFGSLFAPSRLRRGDRLYAGEAAGLQDALFGFGMRYAMVSGHLAAQAWISGDARAYDRSIRRRFGRLLTASGVNRLLFERLGDRSAARVLERAAHASDVRAWLGRHYRGVAWTRWLAPLASRSLRRRVRQPPACDKDCDCTWCRCARSQAAAEPRLVS